MASDVQGIRRTVWALIRHCWSVLVCEETPMSRLEVIARLSAVAILAVYLVFKHWQKLHRPAPREFWTGRPLDVTQLRPRIERLRHDYLAELGFSHHTVCYRRALVIHARRALARVPYFRDRQAEPETHDGPLLTK